MSPTGESPTPHPTGGRSLAPDLARGAMLLLIAVANVTWHLWGQGTWMGSHHLPGASPLDRGVQAFAAVVVDGRVYPMFAFLFGYGMVQFWVSRRSRGFDRTQVRRMLRRRHWAMLLFGAVHALLLFVGDILGAYGLAGLVLVWLLFDRRDITVKIWTWVLVGLLALSAVFTLIGGLVMTTLPAEVLTGIEAQNTSSSFQSIGGMRELISADPHYLASATKRMASWPVATLGAVFSLTIPAAILIGWLAARHRVLEEPARHRALLRRAAVAGIGTGWLGGVPTALQHLGIWQPPAAAWWMVTGLTALTGLAAGIGYVALFGLIAARGGPGGLGRAVAAVGKRSLSFYLLQSIVFAPVLAAWGLGFGARFGTAAAWAFATAVWVVSVALAHLMERRGMRGPFEVALRRLTCGRMEPARALLPSAPGARTP